MQPGSIGCTPAQQYTSQTQQVQSTNQNAPQTPAATQDNTSNPNSAITNPVDTFTPSAQGNQGSRGVHDIQAVRSFLRETDHHADALRTLVRSMLGNNNAIGQGFWAAKAENLQLNEAERLQAQQMVSEDGFFGMEQTTERIMGFAQALIGPNASDEQIESMRAAVQAGFDQVSQMFGGFENLPEVTRDTHAAIMAQFDNWLSGGSTQTE